MKPPITNEDEDIDIECAQTLVDVPHDITEGVGNNDGNIVQGDGTDQWSGTLCEGEGMDINATIDAMGDSGFEDFLARFKVVVIDRHSEIMSDLETDDDKKNLGAE